jgi:hypothetical protein
LGTPWRHTARIKLDVQVDDTPAAAHAIRAAALVTPLAGVSTLVADLGSESCLHDPPRDSSTLPDGSRDRETAAATGAAVSAV